MNKASLIPQPVAAPLPFGETPEECSEDPDSPGPYPATSPLPAAAAPPAVPAASHRDPSPDPLAEALAGVLGTTLALLSFAVPLLAIFGESQANSSRGRPSQEAPTTVLLEAERMAAEPIRSKRIDHRPTAGSAPGP
jgi:hypothetical protein